MGVGIRVGVGTCTLLQAHARVGGEAPGCVRACVLGGVGGGGGEAQRQARARVRARARARVRVRVRVRLARSMAAQKS